MQAAAVISPPPRPFCSLKPAITRVRFINHSSLTSQPIENRRRLRQRHQFCGARVEMATASPSPASVGTAPKWAQKTITIPAQRRGCHLITSKVSSFFLYSIHHEFSLNRSCSFEFRIA